MKFKYIIGTFLVVLVTACGSSHRVVAEDGTIYNVKGNDIHHKGEEISNALSKEEKREINALVNAKVKNEKEREKELRGLRKKQEELEQIEREAEKKRKELEEKEALLKKEQERRERIKNDYIKAQDELQDQFKKYERLQSNDKLDERDEEKWKRKLEELEAEVKETKKEWDNLNNGE